MAARTPATQPARCGVPEVGLTHEGGVELKSPEDMIKAADEAILFGVPHQESPGAIAELLKRTYEALAPGGILYMMDMMTDATGAAPEFSALFAVNMALTTHHGWVFSDEQLRTWPPACWILSRRRRT